MKVKTADLIGPALDWAVAECLGATRIQLYEYNGRRMIRVSLPEDIHAPWEPSRYWGQGGPLIQRECLDVRVFAEHGSPDGGPYWISERHPAVGHGPTPLIAAMRCYCCAKLGEYVDIPEELCQRANS